MIGSETQQQLEELAERLNLDDDDGVLVTEVAPGSAADRALPVVISKRPSASVRGPSTRAIFAPYCGTRPQTRMSYFLPSRARQRVKPAIPAFAAP